ncbi:MAG: magnesium transporter [Ruminococcaceae bacterium]|nr:magnesium transporter [Oscillospiraceae bacterium]
MEEKNINETIELLEQKSFPALKSILNDMMPADIALLFEELDNTDKVIAFRLLGKELAAETFAYLDSDSQINLTQAISDKEIHDVFDRLFIDDAVDAIEEMPANVVTRILNNTDSETRKLINDILKYPERSAGSIMTVEYVNLRRDMTVSQAIEKIRREGSDKETIYTCYVTENRKLVGIVGVSTLLTSKDDQIVEDIMEKNVISVSAYDDKEDVAMTINKYGFIAIPVVDKDSRLIGIVTVDDAIEVIQQETTEDISIMAAMEPIEESYFKTSVFSHAKKRMLWLMILMISATVTGVVMQNYENAISAFPILVSCIPMLMDTGGNSGSQSATMMIRGIALGDIRFSDIFRVVFKEFRISILVSVALGVVNFVRIIIMHSFGILGDTGGQSVYLIAAIVSLSLILVVILAKFIGCTLPLLADKIGLDAALMASPIISTIVDAFAVFIYFKIATTFLNIGF